jgi:hypothetical protein
MLPSSPVEHASAIVEQGSVRPIGRYGSDVSSPPGLRPSVTGAGDVPTGVTPRTRASSSGRVLDLC